MKPLHTYLGRKFFCNYPNFYPNLSYAKVSLNKLQSKFGVQSA